MIEFPKGIKFKYTWRKYQQRVLDDLQEHLTSGHLHVVAPPGSGKTVLGLEVALRLNKPTLILAPTIAIRNQWIQRFCELFLQVEQTPDWISRDIRNPKFMTVATYQGLHAACNNLKIEEDNNDEVESPEEKEVIKSSNPNLAAVVDGLRTQGVKTIVVDEAHHLKNEWWQTLTKVKEKIDPVIVGLTATPPYDVTATEWERYISLNGPVSMEISVPELVVENDLCPHQDYVYFSLPTEKENQGIVDFRVNIEKLFQELRRDETLVAAIENHPAWKEPTKHLDWIYNNFSCYSAFLIFLNANEKEIPKKHRKIVGDKKAEIPALDYEWFEILLDFYLYKEKEHFEAYEEHKKLLENKLLRYGALEKRKINFSFNKKITRLLTSSISKLDAIKEIVDFEFGKLGRDLRLVILSDYIRKEFFTNSSASQLEINKMGVIPIFEKLRRENTAGKKIGVLTGSVIVIPKTAVSAFEVKAAKYGITKIHYAPLSFDDGYVLINQTEQLKHDIVHIITQIFQTGEIEILVGTKSLLGEGWDAPAINSLILASFVGSFVLSNQMRGRAIRTQSGHPNKTGNVWHLVCVDPTSESGGDDVALLKRRFRSFIGLSFKEEPFIENGISRLNLPENIRLKNEIEKTNSTMFHFAGDRENLKSRWHEALKTNAVLEEEIKIPFRETRGIKAVRSMYFKKTIAYFVATLISGVSYYLQQSFSDVMRNMQRLQEIPSLRDILPILLLVTIGAVLIFGRQTYKALKLYLKYRDISKDIQQIGEALLLSLIKVCAIHTDISKLIVKASSDETGAVFCHLKGGTTFEKSAFINALQEIVSPINNPRYIIVRKHTFALTLVQKDYHSVPEILGRNKNFAEYFKMQWQRHVGDCNLIFTRTITGRQILLRSRGKSLSAQFADEVERVSKWK